MTPSPIDHAKLLSFLDGHPDQSLVQYLREGFQSGFHTGISPLPETSLECKNLLSAIESPDLLRNLLESEMSKGFLMGPFSAPPFPVYRVSPIGIAYGKYSGKPRIIVDQSAPHKSASHSSINELISKSEYSLKYTSIDDAIRKIEQLGRGTLMCKTDMSDAFKQISVHPDLWPFQCIKFQGKYMVYTRLTFGSRSSPAIFDKFSQAVAWIARNVFSVENLLYLLDDFISFSPTGSDGAECMVKLLRVFQELNVPLSAKKTVGPTTRIEYLGLILDSQLMTCELPPEKVDRISVFIQGFLSRRSITQVELLKLLGHLNFASRVIPVGRPFVAYLLSLAYSVTELYHHVYLDRDCKAELRMWHDFLRSWNGVSIFLEAIASPAKGMDLWTDSSGTIGFGGYHRGEWFQGRWPSGIWNSTDSTMSMAYLELFPIVVASVLWGRGWTGKRILMHCDNQATVAIIRKGRSKVHVINELMRKLTWTAAKCNFLIQSEFLPGRDNSIADSLSRFQMERFRELAPHANTVPTPIPRSLTSMLDSLIK